VNVHAWQGPDIGEGESPGPMPGKGRGVPNQASDAKWEKPFRNKKNMTRGGLVIEGKRKKGGGEEIRSKTRGGVICKNNSIPERPGADAR